MFGRKNGEQVRENDPRNVQFDPRPKKARSEPISEPLQKASQMAEDFASEMAERIGTQVEVKNLVNAIEENNRLIDVLLAQSKTTNKGIAGIKQIVATLTYGEMDELTTQIKANLDPDDNVKNLPQSLHKWATS